MNLTSGIVRTLEGTGGSRPRPTFKFKFKKEKKILRGISLFSRDSPHNPAYYPKSEKPFKAYEKLQCKEETYRFSGYQDPLIYTNSLLLLC